jgi:hypothetical protein
MVSPVQEDEKAVKLKQTWIILAGTKRGARARSGLAVLKRIFPIRMNGKVNLEILVRISIVIFSRLDSITERIRFPSYIAFPYKLVATST